MARDRTAAHAATAPATARDDGATARAATVTRRDRNRTAKPTDSDRASPIQTAKGVGVQCMGVGVQCQRENPNPNPNSKIETENSSERTPVMTTNERDDYSTGVARRKVSNLLIGDRVDLEGDIFADPRGDTAEGDEMGDSDHPEFAHGFEVVERIEFEPHDVDPAIAVYFESGYACGFPVDHMVEVDAEQVRDDDALAALAKADGYTVEIQFVAGGQPVRAIDPDGAPVGNWHASEVEALASAWRSRTPGVGVQSTGVGVQSKAWGPSSPWPMEMGEDGPIVDMFQPGDEA